MTEEPSCGASLNAPYVFKLHRRASGLLRLAPAFR
jgi:hypothetical protein